MIIILIVKEGLPWKRYLQTDMRPAKNRKKMTIILEGNTITQAHVIFGIIFRIVQAIK